MSRDPRLSEAILKEAILTVASAFRDPQPAGLPERVLSIYVAGLDHGLQIGVRDVASARRLIESMWEGVDSTPDAIRRETEEPVNRLLDAIES